MSDNEVPGRKGTPQSERHRLASEDKSVLSCQNCADENKHVEADGFCVDCHEYMCRECIQFHKRVRATKNHVIHDKGSMLKDARHCKYKDACTETCKRHPGKIIEYYCEKHDEFVCSVCVTLGHISCGVGYIPELSNDIANNDEYKGLIQNINAFLEQSTNADIKISDTLKDVENKSKAYTAKVTKQGEDIINHIRELVQKAIQEKDEFVKDILSILKVSQEENKKVIEELNSMKSSLAAKIDYENQSFVLMKCLQQNIKPTEDAVMNIPFVSKPTPFQFLENPKVTEMKNIDNIGTLIKYRKVVGQCESFDISTDKDKTCPWITKLEVLSDGRLAMADYLNTSVKLLETDNKAISEIKLQHKPWDLIEVRKCQLAVSLRHAGKIQFLVVKDSLSLGHVLYFGEQIGGIATTEDKLIVSLSSSQEIKIIDLTGKLLRTIKTDQYVETLIHNLHCVTFNSKTSMLCVLDKRKHTVNCMTFEGDIKAIYSDEELTEPRVLAVDTDGTMFVCGEKNIHHITADGTKIQIALDQGQDGRSSSSVVVCNGKLCLGGCRNQLYIYQLE